MILINAIPSSFARAFADLGLGEAPKHFKLFCPLKRSRPDPISKHKRRSSGGELCNAESALLEYRRYLSQDNRGGDLESEEGSRSVARRAIFQTLPD